MGDYTSSIVKVEGADTGTGFIVAENLIVTCAHVVGRSNGSVSFFFQNQKEPQTAIIRSDLYLSEENGDIAILEFEGRLPSGVYPLKLGRSLNPDRSKCLVEEHKFKSFGYPSQMSNGLHAEGSILDIINDPNGNLLVQITSIQITHGFSGGPIYDCETERIVGLVVMIVGSKDVLVSDKDKRKILGYLIGAVEPIPHTGFFIPAERVQDLLQRTASDIKLHPPLVIERYLNAAYQYFSSEPYSEIGDRFPNLEKKDVYVQASFRVKNEQKENGKQEVEKNESPIIWMSEFCQDLENQDLIVVGEPGSGKSRLLRHIALHAWQQPSQVGLSRSWLPILVRISELVKASGTLDERLCRAARNDLLTAPNLPDKYFNKWAALSGANWLILLDALDEVGEHDREHFQKMLLQVHSSESGRLIITTRPNALPKYALGSDGIKLYELLPFEPRQVDAFAKAWFEDKSEEFLRQIGRSELREISTFPLLLTIAAHIFQNRGGAPLPVSRSALYEEFVDICLQKGKVSDSEYESNKMRWKIIRFILERIAIVMTMHSVNKLDRIILIIKDYLLDEHKYKKDSAEAEAIEILDLFTKRSGILVKRGDTCEFIHSSFTDFFTAQSLLRKCNDTISIKIRRKLTRNVAGLTPYDLGCVWRSCVSRWRNSRQYNVSIFAFGLLSDSNIDITPMLKRIIHRGIFLSNDIEKIIFSGNVLASGVKVNDEFAEQIIDILLEIARGKSWVRGGWAVQVIGKLTRWHSAIQGLKDLCNDANMDGYVRVRAAEEMAHAGYEEIGLKVGFELANQDEFSITNGAAIKLLGAYNRVNDLMNLVYSKDLHSGRKGWVVRMLGKLDYIDGLQKIMLDQNVNISVREEAANQLANVLVSRKDPDGVRSWFQRRELNYWVLKPFIKALGQLNDVEALESLYYEWQSDYSIETEVVKNLADVLIRIGQASKLVELCEDQKFNDYFFFRRTFLERLGEIGAVTELFYLLDSNKIRFDVRLEIAERLVKLGLKKEVMSRLIEYYPLSEQNYAYSILKILQKSGCRDKLLLLARNKKIEEKKRLDIVKVLGDAKDVIGLRELILEEDQSELINVTSAIALATLGGELEQPELVQQGVKALLNIGQNKICISKVRFAAANGLKERGLRAESAAIISEIVTDQTLAPGDRLDMAKALRELEEYKNSLNTVHSIIGEEGGNWKTKLEAVLELCKLNQLDEAITILQKWVNDEEIDAFVRLKYASSLAALGRIKDALPLLIATLKEDTGMHWDSELAFSTFKEYGNLDVLSDLEEVENTSKSAEIREQARKAIDAIRARIAKEHEAEVAG